MLPIPTLLLCALPLQEIAPPPGPPEPLVREGDYLRLHCHIQDPKAADLALQVAEATWEACAETYGRKTWPDGLERAHRFDVHLYAGAASYRVVDQELTGGNFARNLAFAHFNTRSAHVALQPPITTNTLQVLGLPRQTLRLLAHETAHLYRFAMFPNFRSHPDWLVDGVASRVELQVLEDLKRLAPWQDDPYVSNSIVNVLSLHEDGSLPPAAAILGDTIADLPFYLRYDTRWLFVEFLAAEHPKLLADLLEGAIRVGGGDDFAARLVEMVMEDWEASQWEDLDRGFEAYVGRWKPAWQEIYRALYPFGSGLAQASFDRNAIAWRRQDSGEDYRIAGRMTVLEGQRKQLNVFLGRSHLGFHSVAFTADYGVSLFEYRSAGSRWIRLDSAKVPDLKVGQQMDFAVEVEGRIVSVTIGEGLVLQKEVGDLPLQGPWGLSAQAGSAGIWEIVEAPGW